MKNAIVVAKITSIDADLFGTLPTEVKNEVVELLKIFRTASGKKRPRQYLMEVARLHNGRRGFSLKSLETKLHKLIETQDWMVLVNNAKRTGNGNSRYMTPKVIEEWHRYCDKHKRSYKRAYIHLVQDYRAGKMIGDIDWRKIWEDDERTEGHPMPRSCPPGMELPYGWGIGNFRRHNPPRLEKEASRKGRHAAKKYSTQVRTTRENLPVGAQYQFDDMWHPHDVVHGPSSQRVSPIELACIDISSAHKVAYGLWPRTTDPVSGKRDNLKESHMRFLVAHLLCNIGYHPDGCTLFVENGSAAIRKDLQTVLSTLSDGVIRVSRSGVDREVLLNKWGYDTKGNPDHKAHIESSHNLYQNATDHLPAYQGSNSRLNKPEDHDALCKIVDKMLAAQCQLPEDLARRLEFPVVNWDTFRDCIHEIYEQIAWSNDHALQGWSKRKEQQFKLHPHDIWHSEQAYLNMSPEDKDFWGPVIKKVNITREARLSRKQWWKRGESQLVRLPDYAACMICGEDLAFPRRCPATNEIIVIDQEICSDTMYFKLSSCVSSGGQAVKLEEGKEYLWMVNPFDPRCIFVQDTFGAYIGKCTSLAVPDRGDLKAVGHAVGTARKDFETALNEYERKGAKKALKQAQIDARNTDVLTEGQQRLLEEANEKQQLSDERKNRIAGKSVRDLVR